MASQLIRRVVLPTLSLIVAGNMCATCSAQWLMDSISAKLDELDQPPSAIARLEGTWTIREIGTLRSALGHEEEASEWPVTVKVNYEPISLQHNRPWLRVTFNQGPSSLSAMAVTYEVDEDIYLLIESIIPKFPRDLHDVLSRSISVLVRVVPEGNTVYLYELDSEKLERHAAEWKWTYWQNESGVYVTQLSPDGTRDLLQPGMFRSGQDFLIRLAPLNE